MKKLISVLAMTLCWAVVDLRAESTPLTTLRAVHDLSKIEASKALPVAFEGTVTYYHPVFRYLFVQDDDVAIFVLAPVGTELASGDRVLVKGVTHSEFRPDVLAYSVTVLHHGTLPKSLPVTFDRLMSGTLDCRLVTIRGKVRAADLVLRPDVRSPITFTTHLAYLEMITDGGYIDVLVNSADEKTLKTLLDAEVEVTGVQNGKYDGKWHQLGSVIRAWSFSDVKILKRASASPWSLPVTPMNEVLTGYHVRDLTPRVRVNGTITYYQPGYYRPGSAVVLQNGSESLWVQSLTDKPLRIGDLASATGIPGVSDGAPALTHAEVQDEAEYMPVTPLNVTWEQLAAADVAGMHHYDLVSIEGQVVMEARKASQDEYILAHGGQVFSAIFHHPDSTSQLELPPMREIPVGSRIRVTGICMLQDSTLFTGQAPFNILLRSFDDIVVIANPSLLNIRNLMRAVSVLVLLVVAGAVWSWILGAKVRRQTAALSARIEAEAAMERTTAERERRRSRILEDINGAESLAAILEEITELVSFSLKGVPCWCEVTDGARLGHCAAEGEHLRVISVEIPSRSGPALGKLFASFVAGIEATRHEAEALSAGSKLAALAIETRRLYADLVHRSEFDLLTDMLNRGSMDQLLDAQIVEARQKAGIFGLIYIDLDEFKQVNDLYGHHVGDLYLQEVALRMKQQLRNADMLARLGGDEFAALVPVVRSRAEVEEIAVRLERSFDEPFGAEGYVLHGAASVGVAMYPEDATTGDGLLSAADAAMYVAKHSKRQARMASNDEQESGLARKDRG